MDAKRLKEIKKRAEKATPGPWKPEWNWEHREGHPYIGYATGPDVIGDSLGAIHHQASYNDAAFIAHARQDVPDLVAEVERLRAIEERAIHLLADRETTIGSLKSILRKIHQQANDYKNGDKACDTILHTVSDALAKMEAIN